MNIICFIPVYLTKSGEVIAGEVRIEREREREKGIYLNV